MFLSFLLSSVSSAEAKSQRFVRTEVVNSPQEEFDKSEAWAVCKELTGRREISSQRLSETYPRPLYIREFSSSRDFDRSW